MRALVICLCTARCRTFTNDRVMIMTLAVDRRTRPMVLVLSLVFSCLLTFTRYLSFGKRRCTSLKTELCGSLGEAELAGRHTIWVGNSLLRLHSTEMCFCPSSQSRVGSLTLQCTACVYGVGTMLLSLGHPGLYRVVERILKRGGDPVHHRSTGREIY